MNNRREFFSVTMDEIAAALSDVSPDAEIIETAEAREYQESQAIRAQRFKEQGEALAFVDLPDSI